MSTPNMSLVLPTDHGDSNVWGPILEDVFDLLDAHDHTTGKGVKVPSAALNINADVAWSSSGTNYAITALKAVDFTPTSASSVSALASALFFNSDDANNLYARTQAGVNVKILDGSTLNVSIVGGIGGDYTAIGALLDYDDATDSYRFRQQTSAAVRQYAKLRAADLVLFEYKAAGATPVPTNTWTVKSPAALAGALSFTLPATLSGADALVQATSAGVMSHSNTLTVALTAPSFLYTAVDYIMIPPSAACSTVGSVHTYSAANDEWALGNSATDRVVYPVTVRQGERITAFSVAYNKASNASNTISARLEKVSATGAQTTVGTATIATNAPGASSMGVSGLTETVGNNCYRIIIFQSAAVPSAVDKTFRAYVNVDRPV